MSSDTDALSLGLIKRLQDLEASLLALPPTPGLEGAGVAASLTPSPPSLPSSPSPTQALSPQARSLMADYQRVAGQLAALPRMLLPMALWELRFAASETYPGFPATDAKAFVMALPKPDFEAVHRGAYTPLGQKVRAWLEGQPTSAPRLVVSATTVRGWRQGVLRHTAEAQLLSHDAHDTFAAEVAQQTLSLQLVFRGFVLPDSRLLTATPVWFLDGLLGHEEG